MCGIAGFLGPRLPAGAHAETLTRMTQALAHRGPDDAGTYLSGCVALGHRRLSILDLSPEGHQPMSSPHGRYTIVFNGEIYNFQPIQTELRGQGVKFRGSSDTEVMLAAFETWGVQASLEKFNGMFAFGLWDAERQELLLARDRVGKKPLYYGFIKGNLFFASEMKGIFAAVGGRAIGTDPQALTAMLHYGYVPAPYSIAQDIYKLPPGTILTVPLHNVEQGDLTLDPFPDPVVTNKIQPKRYWSLQQLAQEWERNQYSGDAASALGELRALLADSVKLRMISDVPLGAFLSGGIDSSLIVALMQQQSPSPVRTYTIGFDQSDYDEARHAKAVAQYLHTDHTELYLTGTDALNVVPQLPEMFDEPLADPSSIPTFLVSKLARGSVTVALSGDGGDELFAGYNRYFWPPKIFSRLSFLGSQGRAGIASALRAALPLFRNRYANQLLSALAAQQAVGRPLERIEKLIEALGATDLDDFYFRLLGYWPNGVPVNGCPSARSILAHANPEDFQSVRNFAARMMYFDQAIYLSDDLLAKVDRASMAASLEARAPFLDLRVIEFANRLPLDVRAPGGNKKWLLRQLLHTLVPRELVERPKMGFSVPIGAWLRGPLREWAEDLLSANSLEREPLLDSTRIRACWDEHKRGDRNWQLALWSVLTFQAWKRRWGSL